MSRDRLVSVNKRQFTVFHAWSNLYQAVAAKEDPAHCEALLQLAVNIEAAVKALEDPPINVTGIQETQDDE